MLKNKEDNLTLDQLQGDLNYELRQEELAAAVAQIMGM